MESYNLTLIENGWILTKAPVQNNITGAQEPPKSFFCKDLAAVSARLKDLTGCEEGHKFSVVQD